LLVQAATTTITITGDEDFDAVTITADVTNAAPSPAT